MDIETKIYSKIVAFDLTTSELKKAGFSTTFPFAMKPYNLIRKEMKNLGFEHLQKSVYKSKIAIGKTELMHIIRDLARKLPWFGDCISKIHTADIVNEKEFDLKELVQSAGEFAG